MSNLSWTLPVLGGSSYAVDIVPAGGGAAQVFLNTSWPQDGSGLAQSDADNAAAALETAVAALSSVTSATLTTVAPSSPAPIFAAPALFFNSAQYAAWIYQVSLPGAFYGGISQAYMISSSPADGKLSGTDLASVTAAVVTFCLTMATVTACTVTQQSVTPATL